MLAALNRFSEADEGYSAALKIDPASNATWNKKGLNLARMYRNEEAVEAFNQSLQIYPDSAEVWNNMGSSLFNLGKMRDALTAFEHAIDLDERYIPQRYGDTLSRLQEARQGQVPVAEENNTAPAFPSSIDLKVPPPIFIINYLMIGVGVLAIILLGGIRILHSRRRKEP